MLEEAEINTYVPKSISIPQPLDGSEHKLSAVCITQIPAESHLALALGFDKIRRSADSNKEYKERHPQNNAIKYFLNKLWTVVVTGIIIKN